MRWKVFWVVTNRRKKKSLFGRLISFLLILLLMSLVAVGGAGYWYLDRQGGIIALLENNLSYPEENFYVEIGSISWSIQWGATPLVIDVRDVDITAGTQTLRLPESTLYFGSKSIATQGQPEILIVKGLEVDLTKSADGWGIQDSALGVDTSFNSDKLADQLQQFAPKLGLRQLLLQIDQIRLRDERQNIQDALLLDEATIVVDMSDLTKMQAKLRVSQVQDAEGSGRISIDIDGDLLSRYWQLAATTNNLNAVAFAQYLPDQMSSNDYFSFDNSSNISGNLIASFDAGTVQTANLDISINDAAVKLAALSRDSGRFNTLNLSAAYSLEDNVVKISRAEIELEDKRRLSINGQLLNVHGANIGLSGTVLAQNISIQSIINDWPEAAAPRVREQLDSILPKFIR